MDQVIHSIAAVFFSGVFSLFGLICSGVSVRLIAYALASHFWPTTDGKIVYSDHQDIDVAAGGLRKVYDRFRLAYVYEVEGQEYKGRNIDGRDLRPPGFNIRFGGFEQKGARAFAHRFRKGVAVRVHYDPKNPGQSVLKPGVPSRFFLPLALGLGFFGFATLGWFVIHGSPMSSGGIRVRP